MTHLTNVTIDDFDPLLLYSDYAEWTTPDPSINPGWYNATEEVTGVPWHEATIHYTTAVGASFSLNSTFGAVWIYGAAGPSSTSTNYTITLDGDASSETASNVTDGRALLYANDGLEYGAHELVLENWGSGVGVDLVVLGVDVGDGGSNTTLDSSSSSIAYTPSSSWTTESGTFYGGTSIYTQGPDHSLAFNFSGSALYIYGDSVNDHGPFSVYFNGSATPYGTYNGRSGCGAAGYEKGCEKLGVLKFFVGGLPEGEHRFELVNQGPAEGNQTYFDFDYAEWTTPTTYPSYTVNATCAYGSCTGSAANASASASGTGTGTLTASASASGSGSGSSSSSTSTSASGAMATATLSMQSGLLGFLLVFWTVKNLF